MNEVFVKAVRRWERYRTGSKHPEAAHAELWTEIERLCNAGTFWAGRLGSPTLPPLAEIEPTVYDDYVAAIDASWPKTTSTLTGERIDRWGVSSGTSGRFKRFPWTDTFVYRCYEGGSFPLPLIRALARLQGPPGRHLWLHAYPLNQTSPAGLPVGYGSSFDNDPDIYPPETNDSEEGIRRWRPLYILAADLVSIRTITCEPVFRMLQRIDEDRAFYRACLAGDHPLPDVLPPVDIASDRLAHLERVLSSSGELGPLDLWPSLRLVQTWRSGTAGLQANNLAQLLGPSVKVADLGYNATEGPVCNPLSLDEIGGPIYPYGVIHEFLPLGASPTPDAILKSWELQAGTDYELLLTTAMGLLRYRVGDVVRCTGHFGRLPKIHFQRRVRDEVSMGVSTYSADELADIVSASDIDPRLDVVFGPAADGRGLVVYTPTDLPAEQLEQLHTLLAERNDTYRGTEALSWTHRVRAQTVPPGHPLWTAVRPRHDQGKSLLLISKTLDALTEERRDDG